MAGADRRFPAAKFRDAIHFVAEMAAPEQESRGVEFHWELARTFDTADPSGHPYDYSTPASDILHQESMEVPVIVDHSVRALSGRDTSLGQFDTDLVLLTLLDEDYAQIIDRNGKSLPDYVTIDGDRYNVTKEVPPQGLFDVTLHTLVCVAQDEK